MSVLDVYCRKTVFNLITRRKHSKDYAVLRSDVRLGKVFLSCCLLLFYISSIYSKKNFFLPTPKFFYQIT